VYLHEKVGNFVFVDRYNFHQPTHGKGCIGLSQDVQMSIQSIADPLTYIMSSYADLRSLYLLREIPTLLRETKKRLEESSIEPFLVAQEFHDLDMVQWIIRTTGMDAEQLVDLAFEEDLPIIVEIPEVQEIIRDGYLNQKDVDTLIRWTVEYPPLTRIGYDLLSKLEQRAKLVEKVDLRSFIQLLSEDQAIDLLRFYLLTSTAFAKYGREGYTTVSSLAKYILKDPSLLVDLLNNPNIRKIVASFTDPLIQPRVLLQILRDSETRSLLADLLGVQLQ